MGKMIYATGGNSFVELTPVLSTSEFLKSSAGKTVLPESFHFFHELRNKEDGTPDNKKVSFLIDISASKYFSYATFNVGGQLQYLTIYGGEDGKTPLTDKVPISFSITNIEELINTAGGLEKFVSNAIEIEGKKYLVILLEGNILQLSLNYNEQTSLRYKGNNSIIGISSAVSVYSSRNLSNGFPGVKYAIMDLESNITTLTTAFLFLPYIEVLAIPSSVKMINNCFCGMRNLKYIYGLENIELAENSFNDCYNLEGLVMPSFKTARSSFSNFRQTGLNNRRIDEIVLGSKNEDGFYEIDYQTNGNFIFNGLNKEDLKLKINFSNLLSSSHMFNQVTLDELFLDFSKENNTVNLSDLIQQSSVKKIIIKSNDNFNTSFSNLGRQSELGSIHIYGRTFNMNDIGVDSTLKYIEFNDYLPENSSSQNFPADSATKTFTKILMSYANIDRTVGNPLFNNYRNKFVFKAVFEDGEILPKADPQGFALGWSEDFNAILEAQNLGQPDFEIVTKGSGKEVYAFYPNDIQLRVDSNLIATTEDGSSYSGTLIYLPFGTTVTVRSNFQSEYLDVKGIEDSISGKVYPSVFTFDLTSAVNLRLLTERKLISPINSFDEASSFTADVGDISEETNLVRVSQISGTEAELNGIFTFPVPSPSNRSLQYTTILDPEILSVDNHTIRTIIVPEGVKDIWITLGKYPQLEAIQLPSSLQNIHINDDVIPENLKLIYSNCDLNVIEEEILRHEFLGNTKIILPVKNLFYRKGFSKLINNVVFAIESDQILPEKIGYNNYNAWNVAWIGSSLNDILTDTNERILEEAGYKSKIIRGVEGSPVTYFGIPYVEYNIIMSNSKRDLQDVIVEGSASNVHEEFYYTNDGIEMDMGNSRLYRIRGTFESSIGLKTYDLIKNGASRGVIDVIGGNLTEDGLTTLITPRKSNVIISIPNYIPESHASNCSVDFATCNANGELTSTDVAGYAIIGIRDDKIGSNIVLPSSYSGLPVIAARNIIANCENEDITIFFPDSIKYIFGTVNKTSRVSYFAKLSIGPNTEIILPNPSDASLIYNDIEIREGATRFPFRNSNGFDNENAVQKRVYFKYPQTVIAHRLVEEDLPEKKYLPISDYSIMPLFMGNAIGTDRYNRDILIHRNRVSFIDMTGRNVYNAYGNKFNLCYIDSEIYCGAIAKKVPFVTQTDVFRKDVFKGYFGFYPRTIVGNTTPKTFYAPFNSFGKRLNGIVSEEIFAVSREEGLKITEDYSEFTRTFSVVGYLYNSNEITLSDNPSNISGRRKYIFPHWVEVNNMNLTTLPDGLARTFRLKSGCVLNSGYKSLQSLFDFSPSAFVINNEKAAFSAYNGLRILSAPAEGDPFFNGDYLIDVNYEEFESSEEVVRAMEAKSIITKVNFAQNAPLPTTWGSDNEFKLTWFASIDDLREGANTISTANGNYVFAKISL